MPNPADPQAELPQKIRPDWEGRAAFARRGESSGRIPVREGAPLNRRDEPCFRYGKPNITPAEPFYFREVRHRSGGMTSRSCRFPAYWWPTNEFSRSAVCNRPAEDSARRPALRPTVQGDGGSALRAREFPAGL